jgi:PKD repeat protein
MKRLIKPISFLFVALSIASCSKNKQGVEVVDDTAQRPFVDYQIVSDADGDPFSFEFKNNSANYKTLEWRFGDDSLSLDKSPKHVYLRTGIFEVNLTGISETGATARKLLKININADSVVKLTTQKTAVANQVKFVVDSKAKIVSAKWTFDDDKTTSTDIAPTKQYTAGSFNKFSVTFITEKGTIIELNNKFTTTEGLAQDITAGLTPMVSKDNNGGPNNNEGSLKLTDNNTGTKWLTSNNPNPMDLTATLTLTSPQAVKIYSITSANDADSRDPQKWELLGSDDLTTWTVLDTRDVLYTKRIETQFFAVANPKPFLYYRWHITKNRGNDGLFQVAEWRIYK